MRFDLEIPAISNTKLVYISEGEEISQALSPILYYSINTKDMFIDQFLTIENAFSTREFLADGYEIKRGPSFEVSSDKILITHIAKFSPKEGLRIPLFYKYTINEVVAADVIKIFDYYNVEISSDEYVIETHSGKTFVYMNKSDKLLFIQYVSNLKYTRTILDLVPVFQEATWESLAMTGTLVDFEFMYDRGAIRTTYNGDLFIANINNIKMTRAPLGNIDDPWYVSILNSNFVVVKNGIKYRYTTPEYYRQRFDTDGYIKKVVEKKARKIFPEIIKSQYPISKSMADSVYVYVLDFYTKKVKYALTTSKSDIGTLYVDDVYYTEISDVSSDGFIMLPVSLEEDDIAIVTHFTDENYFEYTSYDLNSLASIENNYCAIFIKPNTPEEGVSIGHKIIGDGGEFNTFDDYTAWVDQNNYLHLSLLSTSASYNTESIEVFDVRQEPELIKDKYSTCKKTVDMLYRDILDGNLIIPSNDTVIAVLDPTRIAEEGRFFMNAEKDKIVGNVSSDFINNIHSVLKKNLDISTKPIIQIQPN